MARGLSELQQRILQLAYTNRHGGRPRPRVSPKMDLFTYEAVGAMYGWPEAHAPTHPGAGSWRFSQRQIGPTAYHRAHATLARDTAEAHGLVDRYNGAHAHRGGLHLTKTSITLAATLVEPPA
jgi:hypothetical protein